MITNNNPEEISLKELAKITDQLNWQSAYNTIRQRAARGKYSTYHKIKGEGYININDKEVPVSIRAKYNQSIISIPAKTSSLAPLLIKERGVISEAENELSAKQLEIALARADLLTKYLNPPQSSPACRTGRLTKVGRLSIKNKFISAYNNEAFPEIFAKLGRVTFKTLERWKKAYLENDKDYRVLAPQYKLKRQSSVSPEQSKILIRLLLNPKKPFISEVIRDAVNVFRTQGMANILSYNTYRRFLENWKNNNYGDYIFYTEGEKGLDDKILPYIRRDYAKIDVGDIIVMDGHVNNYEIINPLTGKPKRMITIGALDMKSQYLAGYEIALTENTNAIACALRRAILTLGKIPKIVYIDNGKAFSSKYFNGDDLDNLEPLFARLGIKTIFAKAYHAQSKPIEPFWDWMAELERLIPTYVGTSIEMKPPRLNRGEKLHMKLYEKAMQGTTIDIFTAHKAMAWWLDQYHNRVKQEGHLKNLTPAEVFNAGRGKGIDKKELIFLMMELSISKLYRKGIRMFGTWFWDKALFGRKLAPGDEVAVRFDILNHSSIFIYESTGEFICEAKEVKDVHPAAGILGTSNDVELLHEQLAEKEMLKSSITGDAKKFLQTEIYPEVTKRLKEANILLISEQIEKQEKCGGETKCTTNNSVKKKRSLINRWKVPENGTGKASGLISKAAEG